MQGERGAKNGIDASNIIPWKAQKWLQRRANERAAAIKVWQVRYNVPYDEISNLLEHEWLSEEEMKDFNIPEEYRDQKIDDETAEKIAPATAFGDGDMNKAELQQEIKDKLQELAMKAVNEFGYKGKQAEDFCKMIVEKGQGCGRVRKLTDDGPAKLSPLKIQLAAHSVPDHFKFHKYPPAQREALLEIVADLEKRGLVRENNESRWLSRMLVIPKPRKPGEEVKYRYVIDLRSYDRRYSAHFRKVPYKKRSICRFSSRKVE